MRKGFAISELEALKSSPLTWTQDDYRLMGECEYWLRARKSHLGLALRQQLHGLVRRATLAYGRRGGECPWDQRNYEWLAGGVPALGAPPDADGTPIVSTLRLTLENGDTQDYTLSPSRLAQVLAIVGLPASQEDEMAAIKAQVAKELEGVAFEGVPEFDPNAPVAPPPPPAPRKRKGPTAVAEGAPL